MEASDRRICVITGANAGIGYETAMRLAVQGWEVVLASRSFQRGNEALMSIIRELRRLDRGPGGYGDGRAVFMELDLASFASVAAFSQGFKKRYGRLDALICNAGIMACPYEATADGFDRQFQTNYLGHVLLFRSLLSRLEQSPSARIIQLSSRAHERSAFKPGDFAGYARPEKASYRPWKAYGASKLFQVIFTARAQKEYSGSRLRFYAVHPGVVWTSLLTRPLPSGLRLALSPLSSLAVAAGLLDTPVKASRTPAFLAELEPAAEGGGYWADQKPREPNPIAHDLSIQDEVWNGSLSLLPV